MNSFRQLLEMPLNHYSVAPFIIKNPQAKPKDDVKDYFIPRDRIRIQHPSVQNKLESILKTSTGYNFNIILAETDISKYKKDIGYEQQYIEQVRKYCEENNIQLENHITFAKNGSTGEALTPWMILHTIGHALLNGNQVIFITRILELIYEFIKEKSKIKSDNEESLSFKKFVNFYKNIFKFKSINLDKITTANELVYDLVAEYLWHGKIRLKANHKHIVDQMAEVEKIIDQVLNHAVGKIIVDYYDPL